MNSSQTGSYRCPACGREHSGRVPYCPACGTPVAAQQQVKLPSKRFHRAAIAAIVAAVVVLALACTGVALFALRGGNIDRKVPVTQSGMRSSIGEAESYLNSAGKDLARGRAAGASIYSVSAKLDTGDHSVSGKETVLYTNRTENDLGEIVFRVYANDIVPGKQGGPQVSVTELKVDGRDARAQLQGSLLNVKLPAGLKKGGSAMVSFSFKEPVPELNPGDLTGLLGGKSQKGYGIYGRSENIYDLGYWMPTVTTYRNGAWESSEVPSFGDVADFDCANYNVTFEVPENFMLAATGAKVSESAGGGRRVCRYAAGPVRDFDIQASPDYRVVERKVGSTNVSSYYLKDSAESGRKVLGYAASALEQYGRHFGPYPYTRLNLCEAPLVGGAAGMEFSGQILIGRMFYGGLGLPDLKMPELGKSFEDLLKGLTGGLLGDTLEFTTVHEVCHQWWGLGVGSDSIDNPWQDESLTNYCAALFFRWRHGPEAYKKVIESQITMQYSAAKLMGAQDMAADSPVNRFANEHQYVAVVYAKGAMFFEALEKRIGEAAFDRSLRDYYRRFVFLYATPYDLVGAFETGTGNQALVASLYQRWMKEAHGDEDIASSSSIPGLGNLNLNDLLKQFGGQNLDLGPLNDLLKDFMDNGLTPPGDNAPAPLPQQPLSTAPQQSI